jgi:para-aminobenzoate synthetase component I
MKPQNRASIISQMNQLGKEKIPFLFIVDFEGRNGYVIPVEELENQGVLCTILNKVWGKKSENSNSNPTISFNPNPIPFEKYDSIFSKVKSEILYGNSYLLNLTFPTFIGIDLPLAQIYHLASAPYKLCFQDSFLCYSPETFIKIKEQKIYSYPMKGTIDAEIPNATQQLEQNQKELYEHYTIVDLIRNDLALVSKNVEVIKFRYFERINTKKGAILQTISEIRGDLPVKWNESLGDLLFTLLPAGSISGAPKEKTVEIITRNEIENRGYYTGVMGVFDGENLDSAVMIRFIRKEEDGSCFYHSGGGITFLSDSHEEYQEIISKIYVPIS